MNLNDVVDPASDDGLIVPAVCEVRYEYTPRFPEILAHLQTSILVTTYQAGKLLVLGVHDGRMQISFLGYEQPMGLAVSRGRIAIGSRKQLHFLVPAHETQDQQAAYDGCFIPRSSFYTGNIRGHDLARGIKIYGLLIRFFRLWRLCTMTTASCRSGVHHLFRNWSIKIVVT